MGQEVTRAVLGDLAGAVEDVRVEHRTDPGPVRGQRQLPVGLDLLGDPGQLGRRVGVQPAQPGTETALLAPQPVQVVAYAGGRSGLDPG
ncbi:hypothetical protein Airi01_027130 [Actinoallomurus iriomotensis]|uniref:Uncharacterized protein n=1 Tax=Actinoallomurus iriomotensis TaxID=478107 RepID=A0A9W6RE89_9ACTN|nr:hypothetical protein Airi01_027130 [Actinoallomurus iriomotensis]